jgi:LPS O-antigen subunit length determinant protein (WzzB/FepE family)
MEHNSQRSLASEYDDEIDLRELLHAIFEGKWIILILTIVAAIASVSYSLSLPNLYQSKAILVAHQSNGNTGALQGMGNLANLAGVTLPTQGADSNSAKALKKINTLSFFEDSILPNISLHELMAQKSWDPKTNTLAFDEKIYDESSNKWVRNFSPPKNLIPSAQESFKVFKNHFSMTEDREGGFITLKVKHHSPYVAKKWAVLLVDEINLFYQKKDKAEAEKAISYLNTQILKTNLTEIKQVFASLLQQETQKIMLTEAGESYVYEYLDPPAVMEIKSEPNRKTICILGTLLGLIFGIFIVLIRFFFKKELP